MVSNTSKLSMGMRFLNANWLLPQQLTHLVVYGMTGSGKSQTLRGCAERAFVRGVKIIDLYSGGANEEMYWGLKSSHPFWANGRELKFGNSSLKAKEFPVKCLIPMSRTVPHELPDFCQLFTIPITKITESDLKAILGNALTKNEVALWRKIAEKINKKTTLIDLLNYIVDAQKSSERVPGVHGTGISSVYNMFSTFEKNMLFSSEINPLSLDLRSEIKNKGVITSLALKYYPEELWGFIINHIMYTTYSLILKGEIKHPVILLVREAGDFLVSAGEASPQEQAIKNTFTHILRKGRKHQLFFWIDNQTPMNLDIVKTQFPVKICHFVDNMAELENALGDLGALLLTREDYMNLRTFGRGRCFVLEQRGLFAPQMLPPQSRMSGDEGADFIDLWRKEKGNRFKNMKSEMQPAYDEYEKAYKDWKDIIKKRKEKMKVLRELQKLKKSEQKTSERVIKIKEIKEKVIENKAIEMEQNKPSFW